MNNLTLRGRLPQNLPDKETINDILLELNDSKMFDIYCTNLNYPHTSWLANGKSFHQWVEKGEISIMECDFKSQFQSIFDSNQNDIITPTRFKEIRYDIFRYPSRLEVKWKNNSNLNNKEWIEKMSLCNDTYLRLKDYIGLDIIQDQYQNGYFIIDFILSECKVI